MFLIAIPSFSITLSTLKSSGIETYVVFKDEISPEAVKDFGIWDNSVVCLINTMESGAHRYEVVGGEFTRKSEDIDTFSRYKNEIKNHAISGSEFLKEVGSLSDNTVEIVQTAGLMEAESKVHCEGSYLSTNSCDWYHVSWQYLRILNMVSAPSWHGSFYTSQLSEFYGSEQETSVLISGAADYGIFRQIAQHESSKKIKGSNDS